MNKKDSHIDISQYNKEIDEAIARVEAGEYLTQREVDVIGGLGPLTKEDEKAISDFIQARKKNRLKRKAALLLNIQLRKKNNHLLITPINLIQPC
jgi:hypothetical protein